MPKSAKTEKPLQSKNARLKAGSKNQRFSKQEPSNLILEHALSNNQGCRKAEIRPIEPDAGNAAEGRFPIFHSFLSPYMNRANTARLDTLREI